MKFATHPLRVVALAIACGLGASTAALAVDNPSTPGIHTYRTALTQTYGSPYPVTGSLELADDGNGILHGYYRPDDNGSLVPVSGGRDGSHVWIDFGATARFKIDGHFDGQKIVGGVVDGAPVGQLEFIATPDVTR